MRLIFLEEPLKSDEELEMLFPILHLHDHVGFVFHSEEERNKNHQLFLNWLNEKQPISTSVSFYYLNEDYISLHQQ